MLKTAFAAIAISALLVTGSVHAQSTEERLDRLERRLESSALLELSNQNEQLRREIQRLTGRIDELEREIEGTRRQQRSLYQDLDQRLQALGAEGVDMPDEEIAEADEEAPVVAETPRLDDAVEGDVEVPDTEADEVAEPETTAPEDERDALAEAEEMLDQAEEAETETRREPTGDAGEAYREAFNLLRDGRYAQAGDGFRQVIEDHPDTTEADNALYWLAESYYVVRTFEEAKGYFTEVAEDIDNNKRPDAMLKLGYIHYEEGDYADAREILETVRDEFSGTTVATLAENRLNRMRDEGR
ncbi:tol-pal system protein YbgF [Methylonatrum kenyense]|uniref:tol-pal system protein YbgF n=1 Tax=Methylonatrum kenyense TaxID=455253 RepID=UPI0020BD6B5F|nr:tol-pal system protein YbgF [Methylonatrum kenyense]MCK8516171.1 tol-pal system protein YbgF [Methylonatrum kenyense]